MLRNLGRSCREIARNQRFSTKSGTNPAWLSKLTVEFEFFYHGRPSAPAATSLCSRVFGVFNLLGILGVFGADRRGLTFPCRDQFALNPGPLGGVHHRLFTLGRSFVDRQVGTGILRTWRRLGWGSTQRQIGNRNRTAAQGQRTQGQRRHQQRADGSSPRYPTRRHALAIPNPPYVAPTDTYLLGCGWPLK